jgi:uncharacterized membrane protein
MPKLIALYIKNVAFGFALAAVFVGLLFWFNVANLWHLVSTSPVGWIAAMMLFMFNGIIFAGAQFAFTILRMEEPEAPKGGTRSPQPVCSLTPIPVMQDDR